MCVLPGSGFQGSNGFTAVFSIIYIYRGFLKSWGISKRFQVIHDWDTPTSPGHLHFQDLEPRWPSPAEQFGRNL